MAKKYARGKTFQSKTRPEARPPRIKGRVVNDGVTPRARNTTMPAPTTDTQEPRGKGLTRGGRKKGRM